MTHPAFAFKRTTHRASAKRGRPEFAFQVSVAKYLRYALPPDWRFTASAAGVYLGPKLAGEMKLVGQEPGWTDLILRQKHTGVTRWLECKAPNGVLTPEQKTFRDDCPHAWAEARTLEQVEGALWAWGITPRCAISQAHRYHINLDPE